MKSILTALGTLVVIHASWGQSWVGMDAGGHQSNVYYENSAGDQDKSIKGVPATYASIYYMHELVSSGNSKKLYDMPDYLLTVEIGYKRAQSRDSDSNLLNRWTMDYFSTSVGVRHIVSTKKKIAPFIGAAISMDRLLSGVQQIGFEQYDLTDELSIFNLGLVGEGGLKYSINHDVLGTFGISYTYGLSDIEPDEEKGRLSGFKVGVGIHFLISN
jgi:hypothetical protein